MVPPRNATRRLPSEGISIEVLMEVAHHRMDLEPLVLVDQPRCCLEQELVADVKGDVAEQWPRGSHGVEEDSGLVTGACSELDEGVRGCLAGDFSACALPGRRSARVG